MELNYKMLGQGEPLLILHGLFGMLDNWQTLGRRFAEHHLVYLLDQRNHGRSPHVQSMSYPEMAEDLHEFMVANWIHETSVLGHSMGGKTAMQLALTYPDSVSKLIVVDMAPKAYSGGHEFIFEALQELDLQAIQDRQEADTQLAERIAEQSIRLFLLKNLSRAKGGGYRWKMNLPVIYEDYPQILAPLEAGSTYPGPALFIRGERSGYLRDEDWPDILERFPRARLETVAGAGHWVHAEAPDELFQLVIRFLREGE